jgi:hypothetical protein
MNEIDNCLSTEMAGHARRHKSTAIPLWEPHISNSASIFMVKVNQFWKRAYI